MVEVDDRVLIDQSLQGDSSAFGVLVRRYQDRLYNTVYRLVGNHEDAQDTLQEAFLNAYQSLRSFKGDSRFFTWIYRIAINAAISLKRKRKNAVSIDAGLVDGIPFDPVDESAGIEPERAIEQAEEEQILQDALDRLSDDHRAVLVMKEIEGFKYEDIAEVLRIPIGTVRSRLHRARVELREVLERMKV